MPIVVDAIPYDQFIEWWIMSIESGDNYQRAE
jgi:hypothetical protein